MEPFTNIAEKRTNIMHPNSLKNLKPFPPGKSGNPLGRNKGAISITDAIKERLEKNFPEKPAVITGPDGKKYKKARKTYLQKIVETIFDNAIKEKDNRILTQIWAYVDGGPKAKLDLAVDKENLSELTEFFKAIGTKQHKK